MNLREPSVFPPSRPASKLGEVERTRFAANRMESLCRVRLGHAYPASNECSFGGLP